MTLIEQQERGRRAQELLDNELLQEALKALSDEVQVQWLACPARDKEGKEALWQLAKTADKFKAVLAGYVQTGKLAADQLKRYEKESLLKRFADRF